MADERSVTLRNTVADPDYVAEDASRDRLDLLHEHPLLREVEVAPRRPAEGAEIHEADA